MDRNYVAVVAAGCDLDPRLVEQMLDTTRYILDSTRLPFGHSGQPVDQRVLNTRMLEVLEDLHDRIVRLEERARRDDRTSW